MSKNGLKELLSEDRPLVGVAWTDDVSRDDVSQAKKLGMDVAELRIDRFKAADSASLASVLEIFDKTPTIATIRDESEGGGWRGGNDKKEAVIRSLMPLVDCIDIELSQISKYGELISEAHQSNKLIIGSFHDYEGTPGEQELMAICESSAEADLVKIVARARTEDDVWRLLQILRIDSIKNRAIVIGLGPSASYTRCLFPMLGSRITFARGLNEASEPGQIPLDKMFDIMKIFSAS